jgi:repressor of nif and glnA expression
MKETSMTKTILAILKVLEKHSQEVIGSREISRQLTSYGIELTERTIRYHLKIMDERGLTEVHGKEGRTITERGLEELKNAHVSERVGFIISKIESLSYQSDFDIEKKAGNVVLNISSFPASKVKEARKLAGKVFDSPYVMSDRVKMAREGEGIGDYVVPEGMVGLGTVCSVTINSVFLKHGIPVASKYGGLMEVDKEGPTRFTSLISYEGSSLDPLVVFIHSRMTSVNKAMKGETGCVLASFREIPIVTIREAMDLQNRMKDLGIGGLLKVGAPNHALYEMPVGMDKAGMVVVGGLNPVAALQEAGIDTINKAMSVMHRYEDLIPFGEAMKALDG